MQVRLDSQPDRRRGGCAVMIVHASTIQPVHSQASPKRAQERLIGALAAETRRLVVTAIDDVLAARAEFHSASTRHPAGMTEGGRVGISGSLSLREQGEKSPTENPTASARLGLARLGLARMASSLGPASRLSRDGAGRPRRWRDRWRATRTWPRSRALSRIEGLRASDHRRRQYSAPSSCRCRGCSEKFPRPC